MYSKLQAMHTDTQKKNGHKILNAWETPTADAATAAAVRKIFASEG